MYKSMKYEFLLFYLLKDLKGRNDTCFILVKVIKAKR